jgi:hypothetical protein
MNLDNKKIVFSLTFISTIFFCVILILSGFLLVKFYEKDPFESQTNELKKQLSEIENNNFDFQEEIKSLKQDNQKLKQLIELENKNKKSIAFDLNFFFEETYFYYLACYSSVYCSYYSEECTDEEWDYYDSLCFASDNSEEEFYKKIDELLRED